MQWRKIPSYAGRAEEKCDPALHSVYKLNNDTFFFAIQHAPLIALSGHLQAWSISAKFEEMPPIKTNCRKCFFKILMFSKSVGGCVHVSHIKKN